jgi:hypothetical protein
MHPAEDDLRCTLCNVSHSCWRRWEASLSGRYASGGAMRQALIKARNRNSAQQVCVLCRATQQHTAVALVCSRLNMETRRALVTLRHLIRQASHVLWHVCGTGLHRNHSISFVKDTMELVNIHNRPWTRLPVTATFSYPLPHLTCALPYTANKNPMNA